MAANAPASAQAKPLPGPRGLPVVGSLFNVKNAPHKTLSELARKYGDVYMVRLGSVQTVIITHPDIMRDAFSRTELSDRWVSSIMQAVSQGDDLALSPYGDHWRQLQRFANRQILSHRRIQDIRKLYIEDAVNALVSDIGSLADGNMPLSPRQTFPSANVTMIFRAIFGRSENDTAEFDDKLQDLLTASFWIFANASAVNPADYIPALRFLPNHAVKEAETVAESLTEILNFLIESVLARPDVNLDNPRCLAEVMLASERDGEITRDMTRDLIGDILVAGTDTMAQTMTWMLLILANRPHIQDRLYQELADTIASDEMPGIEHQHNLPQLHAALLETMRFKPVGPFGLPHKARNECMLNGFTIPEGAQVLGNIYSVHRDSRFWDSPDEFIAERFLPQADGTPSTALTNGAFIPFGVGRRGCPGQGFAEVVLWLQASRLLHKYKFEPVSADSAPISEEELFGVTLSPNPYSLKVTRR